MTTISRAARAVSVLSLLVALVAAIPSVPAEALNPTASLTLVAQTPWTTTRDPMLRIAVTGTNTGNARFGDLSVEVAFGASFVSRLQYEAALSTGPASDVFSVDVPFRGTLEPDKPRPFTVTVDLSAVAAVSATDTRVYPVRVDLRSGGVVVASLVTCAIHVVRAPESPMLLSTWTDLEGPVAFAPDGRLADPNLEAAIASDGALAAPVGALRDLAVGGNTTPFDLAIEPLLVEQVERMTDGYTRTDGTEVTASDAGAIAARDFLASLREVVASPGIETVAIPYAGPSMPALLNSGLDADLERQADVGRRILQDSLGARPVTTVARPTHGALNDAAVGWLAAHGTATVLANADTVERTPQPNGFAPPPVASVAGGGHGSVSLVLPDPGVERLLERPDLLADPVRAAQAVLGELAVIWREQPVPAPQPDGTATVRGLGVSLPPDLPPGVWTPLLDRLTRAPFLEPVHAQDLANDVNPGPETTSLRTQDTSAFGSDYAGQIRAQQDHVRAYASMLTTPSDVPTRLRRNLLIAESATFVGNETDGRAWISSVAQVTDEAFASTTPEVAQLFTFTSGEGTIPLRMGDPGDVPLRVIVQLNASQFTFPDGAQQEVVLERPNQIVTFRVEAKSSGQNPIQVLVSAPSGDHIASQTIVVRTTALNQVALMITVAAGGGLLLLFVRRWQRRKSRSI